MAEPKPSTFNFTSVQWSQPCRQIKYPEILSATENFNESSLIGCGGFGKVYKGNINNGSKLVVAAFKRLDSMSNQGESEFWAEVELLTKLRHAYLVSLIGYCCYEKELILVYEYMPNGTLSDHLYKLGSRLSWLQRLQICIGAGRGLDYLHTGTGIEFGVIHRDVKSSNILLNERWAAKVSDFGLSRISPANQPSTYVNTFIKGTFGYLDPNYFATGKLTRKSDVYAFGVILFEVLCRKRPLDPSLDYGLVTWAQDSIKEGNLKHIIDNDIRSQISPKCLKKFVRIAQRCLDYHPKQRPTMAEVVVGLEFVLTLQEKIDNSLQTASKTLFGRMVDMFPFPSKPENSDILISSRRSLHVSTQPTTPKEKRKWSFRRSSATTTATATATAISTTTPSSTNIRSTPPPSLQPELFEIHYASATVATQEVAAIMMSQTSTINVEENVAATLIQSVFRSYLARKELSFLKALVKLQALVRGRIVRKQVARTVCCMHSMMTAQARARAHRRRRRRRSHN